MLAPQSAKSDEDDPPENELREFLLGVPLGNEKRKEILETLGKVCVIGLECAALRGIGCMYEQPVHSRLAFCSTGGGLQNAAASINCESTRAWPLLRCEHGSLI